MLLIHKSHSFHFTCICLQGKPATSNMADALTHRSAEPHSQRWRAADFRSEPTPFLPLSIDLNVATSNCLRTRICVIMFTFIDEKRDDIVYVKLFHLSH